MLRAFAPFLFAMVAVACADPVSDAPALQSAEPRSTIPAIGQAKAPVDQLIPWLLSEDRQLRGIPFSEVIVDVTGKKVLAFDPKNEVDQRVVKAISAVCDEATKRSNAEDSPIQKVARINEVSSHFEIGRASCRERV